MRPFWRRCVGHIETTETADAPDVTGGRSLISGGALLAVAMLGANGGNYLLNLLLGRWLTPAEFADANLMVTLMLLVTAVAAPLQLVAARYVGMHEASGSPAQGAAVVAWLYRRAAVAGLVMAAIIALPAPLWSTLFRTEDPWPFVLLAAGMPAYLTQSVRRGTLQGHLRFGRLAVSFIAEMLARLGVAAGLVAAGFGVTGATAGLTASFLVTWAVVRYLQPLDAADRLEAAAVSDLRRFVAPTAVFLVGQILINNGDVLVVKAAFPRDAAGVYSAVALMGRAVFFLSWSAVATLFPAVARREATGSNTDELLVGGLVVVGVACAGMVAASALFGNLFFRSILGPEYEAAASMLVSYATATSLFAVANLVVTHQLSLGRTIQSRLLVIGAVGQTVLVVLARSSLPAVVNVQVLAMTALAAVVLGSVLLEMRVTSATR